MWPAGHSKGRPSSLRGGRSTLTLEPQLVWIDYPIGIWIDHASPWQQFRCSVWRVFDTTVPAPSSLVCLGYYNPCAKRHVVSVTIPVPGDLSMTWVLQSQYSGACHGLLFFPVLKLLSSWVIPLDTWLLQFILSLSYCVMIGLCIIS